MEKNTFGSWKGARFTAAKIDPVQLFVGQLWRDNYDYRLD